MTIHNEVHKCTDCQAYPDINLKKQNNLVISTNETSIPKLSKTLSSTEKSMYTHQTCYNCTQSVVYVLRNNVNHIWYCRKIYDVISYRVFNPGPRCSDIRPSHTLTCIEDPYLLQKNSNVYINLKVTFSF